MIWRPALPSATYAYFPETYTSVAPPEVLYVPTTLGAAGFEIFTTCSPELYPAMFAYFPETYTPNAKSPMLSVLASVGVFGFEISMI